jgi:outer membrane cobalamin receptor
MKSMLSGWLKVFADGSWSDRLPTTQERYWTDSTIIRTGGIIKEQHAFFQGGFDINAGSNLKLRLTGFQRIVKHAIIYRPDTTNFGSSAIRISNVSEVQILGLNGQVSLQWGPFEVLGVMTLTRNRQEDTLKILMPDVIFAGEASYRDLFFNDKLEAKFGVRSRFYNRQHGMQFDPQTLSYNQYKADYIGRSTTLDLFMILKIGDAHLSLYWENILNARYVLAPIYPMPGRHIRLGVNWVFID